MGACQHITAYGHRFKNTRAVFRADDSSTSAGLSNFTASEHRNIPHESILDRLTFLLAVLSTDLSFLHD